MNPWLQALLGVVLALVLMLVNGVVLIYMLRKVLAHLHVRLGPMEQGWHGTLQTIWDVLKLLSKEDITPTGVDKALYFIAPAIVFVPSLAAYGAIAFSRTLSIADSPNGLLYTFAVLSLVPLGVLAAGWASNNKWSLLGGMRAVAQQITYEVPLLLSALPVVLLARSMNLTDIVNAQSGLWFVVPMFPAFVMFWISALIELNQTPFDMSEAESELVAGFATEYSSMKFGLLFLSEFSNTFIMSALLVTLFLGGWRIPLVPYEWYAPLAPAVFILKTYLIIFAFMWIRGTMPRVRIDQMMAFGWKILLPASLAWLMLTGLFVKLGQLAAKAAGS
jgi:NADH-quinone oxidoreductase subunit H